MPKLTKKESTNSITARFQEARKRLDAQRKMELEQARHALFRSIHSFDNVTLDMLKFSYAIEGFIKMGKIQLAGNPFVSTPKLSLEVSGFIRQFSDLTRYKGQLLVTQDEIALSFVNMMKSLIERAKTPNYHQVASQQLLGFMLFHNFEITHQNQTFRISDIVKAEFSLEDIYRCQMNPQSMPFAYNSWLESQGYPSKWDLEQIMNIRPHFSFLPMFKQYQSDPMDVEPMPMEIERTVQNRWNIR